MLRKSKNSIFHVKLFATFLRCFHLSHYLTDIQRLEKVLIARHLLFKESTFLPKGESLKLKDVICNVPEFAANVSNNLPCASGSKDVVIVKLKRKWQYRGYVYSKSVRPDFSFKLLRYLKLKIHLCYEIEVSISNIQANLVCKSSTEFF